MAGEAARQGATLTLPPTPDFDHYSVTSAIIAAEPQAEGRLIALQWSDGRKSRYHAIWLRDNASDPEVMNLETREAWSDVTALPADPRIAAASVDAAGALELRWVEEPMVSRYHPGWLRAHDYSNPEDASSRDPAAIAPVLWNAASLAEPPSFHGAAILEDDAVLEEWLKALAVYGIARLRNVLCEPGMVARVAERLGPVRSSNFGRVFDVRVKSGPGSNAYTDKALTPHTDLPTREYQPGLQFLHCLKASAMGGRAVMVDGFKVAELIAARDPQAYGALCTISWPMTNRALDSDYCWQAPVICRNDSGAVTELRVAPFLRAPFNGAFQEVEEAYRSLRLFFQTVGEPDLQLVFDYRPGDLIAMDNRRLLHGREAYDAAAGERWLQGCYGEREELQSRLRILARRRHAGRRHSRT